MSLHQSQTFWAEKWDKAEGESAGIDGKVSLGPMNMGRGDFATEDMRETEWIRGWGVDGAAWASKEKWVGMVY